VDTGEKRRRIRTDGGFTLIELMIVVAIIGVLAAIAIPAYRDYVKRARMSEVLAAIDAIAQGASEYHGVTGYFPEASYTAGNLANFSQEYANIQLIDEPDRNTDIRIRSTFNANLDLTEITSDYGQLDMVVSYDTSTGYDKQWDLNQTNTTIDPIYIPKK
jgi:prepilin-type N-terminal cleavage/methylation domain-containing protein